jgi:hypothetical protein
MTKFYRTVILAYLAASLFACGERSLLNSGWDRRAVLDDGRYIYAALNNGSIRVY